LSKKNKSRRDNTAKSSEPKAPATGMSEALKAAGIVADRVIAAVEPDAVPEVVTEPEAAPIETTEPEAAATTGASETAPEATAAPELTAEQLEAIAAAEAKVETAKVDLAKARAELASLKKGPKGDAVDAAGNPLSAGKKAWLTRVARGFEPKPKAPKPPRDPNAPLTAGQKAQLTRALRKADPNYQPPKKAAAKAPAKDRLDAAIGAAFPVEAVPAATVEATA
jgi:hypothetical protein